MHRPTVSVFNHADPKAILKEVRLPPVFLTPIRSDIVQFVHDNLARNSRQAHGVDPRAGMKHSAESWGTGRAVARVPRVSGSGTSRNSQGAFANSVRKGRMAFPLHIWRRWHRKVNLRQRRHALASAIAATAIPSLVLARGHQIMKVPQLPLVLDNEVNKVSKTKEAVQLLKRFGIHEDVKRVIAARRVRAGYGKARNGRYKNRRGPLFIVTDEARALTLALRNIPGVSTLNVKRLNIKHLAPGSNLGRFTIYTEDAFKALGAAFGSFKQAGERKNFLLHREVLSNADVSKLINSDTIQKALRPKKTLKKAHSKQKKNPLKNKKEMAKLNPYSAILRKLNQDKAGKKIKKDKAVVKANKTTRRAQLAESIAKLDNKNVENKEEYRQLYKDINL